MHDHLMRGLGPEGRYRYVATVYTDAAREAARRHGLTGASAVALARALGAGLCLATLTNGGERVTLQWHTDGPLGVVVADAHDDGNVRGYVRGPAGLMLPEGGAGGAGGRPSVAAAVGSGGTLTVIRDLGLRDAYIGQGEVVDGEIDRDVERYLTVSEQIDSALRCEVVPDPDGGARLVRAAAVLIQAMPVKDSEGVGEHVAAVRATLGAGALWDLLSGDNGARLDAGMLAASVVPEGAVGVLSEVPVQFHCGCDGERVRTALSTLGPADLDKLAEERGGAEVTCQFCAETHRLDPDGVRALARELRSTLN